MHAGEEDARGEEAGGAGGQGAPARLRPGGAGGDGAGGAALHPVPPRPPPPHVRRRPHARGRRPCRPLGGLSLALAARPQVLLVFLLAPPAAAAAAGLRRLLLRPLLLRPHRRLLPARPGRRALRSQMTPRPPCHTGPRRRR
uniref:Uncharacterized protein n=1 Tax=Oryza brachyantha TaxID=4533 RepID=J3MD81_ORYBR